MSKGDKRRLSNVSAEEYASNYDRIFRGVEPEIPTATQAEYTAIVKYVPPDLTKMDHPTACKYLVEGMRVKILKQADDRESGWKNIWVDMMDKHVGSVFTIEDIEKAGGISFEEIGCQFPAFCLQIIKPEDSNDS
ncbi:MAG: hypothetical protein KAS32_01450 [Candidatus Peribacteraceae bacterium]|nr:hypothetical protein [Candidatus Peribacteraceae bacterium]